MRYMQNEARAFMNCAHGQCTEGFGRDQLLTYLREVHTGCRQRGLLEHLEPVAVAAQVEEFFKLEKGSTAELLTTRTSTTKRS